MRDPVKLIGTHEAARLVERRNRRDLIFLCYVIFLAVVVPILFGLFHQ